MTIERKWLSFLQSLCQRSMCLRKRVSGIHNVIPAEIVPGEAGIHNVIPAEIVSGEAGIHNVIPAELVPAEHVPAKAGSVNP